MRVNVDVEARRAMALERDRIMRKERRPPSLIEQAAEAWTKREEAEKRRGEEEERGIHREENAPALSLETIIAEKQARQREAKEDDAGWSQYHTCGEEEENRKPRRLNAASIWMFARRIMAREWARALGKKREDPRLYALEQAAEEWKRKGEDEVRTKVILGEMSLAEAARARALEKELLNAKQKEEEHQKLKRVDWVRGKRQKLGQRISEGRGATDWTEGGQGGIAYECWRS